MISRIRIQVGIEIGMWHWMVSRAFISHECESSDITLSCNYVDVYAFLANTWQRRVSNHLGKHFMMCNKYHRPDRNPIVLCRKPSSAGNLEGVGAADEDRLYGQREQKSAKCVTLLDSVRAIEAITLAHPSFALTPLRSSSRPRAVYLGNLCAPSVHFSISD